MFQSLKPLRSRRQRGENDAWTNKADLNGDRVVDDADLLLVLLNFGSGC
jgi:hypothetical protein